MRITATIALCGLIALPVQAAEMKVEVNIPRLNVAEYHRPYVAIWVEGQDQTARANLAVWYQQTTTNEGAGTKWLPDLRQWWRRSGRGLRLPVDGVTGATRPAGSHTLAFDDRNAPLRDLPPGSYRVVVEAVREVGGRELLKLPLQWPPTAAQEARAQGKNELGAVRLSATP